MTSPFGALAPSPFQERMRRLGARLPSNRLGRKGASLMLGLAGGRAKRPYDVTIFGSQHARLHPYDNICEKRVYLTPQQWDGDERMLLGDVISNFAGRTFHFVDVGANVGLYTLFARAEVERAGATLNAACIEADPEMVARLEFNLAASGAGDEIAVFQCAASDGEGSLKFAVDRSSRGLSKVSRTGALDVRARPLLIMLREAGFEKTDAMKIDIEGYELPVIAGFLRDAPKSLWPNLVILETAHAGDGSNAESAMQGAGYSVRLRTRRNVVLVRPA